MQFTIEVTDAARLTGLQRAVDAYNALNPASAKTQAEFLQWSIDNQLTEYARTLTKPSSRSSNSWTGSPQKSGLQSGMPQRPTR